MKYIFLTNNIVHEIIPDLDPVFPGVPIEQRYSPDFLSRCVAVEDAEEPPAGYMYDPQTGTFSAPPEPEETEE